MVITAEQQPERPYVLCHHDAGIAILSLNRPETSNSLSIPMMTALHHEIDSASSDDTVKVVLLRGSGRAFCAGHDLKELTGRRADADGGRAFFAATMARCAALMQAVATCPKPVLAQVEGVATAAGCQLVASCDLAVAARRARFGTPGVNIGLFCTTPMVPVSRNIARKHAMEMLMLGDLIDAEKAKEFGLVNWVVEGGELADKTMEIARKIAMKSACALRIGKRAFYRQIDLSLPEAYTYASDVMAENLMAEDAAEGIQAFIDKRKPMWSSQPCSSTIRCSKL